MPESSGSSYRTLREQESVRVYDFHRPDKFSRENIGALRVLHEHMARILATNISSHIHTAVEVSLVAIDQITYDKFTEQIGAPVILGIACFEPLEGKMGIEICPSIAYPLIERLLGGMAQSGKMERPLTEIETAVIRTVFERLIAAVQEGWQNVTDLQAALESVENSPFFGQFAPPNEIIIQAGFLLEMGNQEGRVNLAWPHMMLEPILPDLAVQQWMGGSTDEDETQHPQQRETVKGHLHRVKLPLTAELGRTRVSIRDLVNLEEGDVIKLNRTTQQSIDIRIGEQKLFVARPGRSGQKMAVQLIGKEGRNT